MPFILSPDVLSTTLSYCTLLQVVTKRRGNELLNRQSVVYGPSISHIMRQLCSSGTGVLATVPMFYRARPLEFNDAGLYAMAVICGAMRLNCIFSRAASLPLS